MFRRYRPLTTLAVTLLLMAGCAGGATGDASQSDVAPSDAVSAAPTEAARSEGAAPESAAPSIGGATCPAESEAEGATCQVVSGTANIFGAGHDAAPAAGGGPGSVPPVWDIPDGATHMVVAEAAGSVAPVPSSRGNGPEGAGTSLGLTTDINSVGGISGIVNRSNAMFLVGVFLTDEEPIEGDHPERLGFTDNEDFTELAPLIGQTFFIGDGQGKTFVIPEGATRLFLGFADAFDVHGDPGWYGNNSGELAVTVAFASE